MVNRVDAEKLRNQGNTVLKRVTQVTVGASIAVSVALAGLFGAAAADTKEDTNAATEITEDASATNATVETSSEATTTTLQSWSSPNISRGDGMATSGGS